MIWTTLMIVIGVIVLLLLILAIILNRKNKVKPNYRAIFIIGITWIPLGIATGNYVFVIAGIAMIILGISNKKKWREEPRWSELTPEVRRLKIILISVLTLVLIAGIGVFLLYR